jgi:predicted ABC-type ATPase
MPAMYIIAGPNGAGKTTAAYSLLPDVFSAIEFVNADEIAKGVSPFNPEGAAFTAGRIMLERLNELITKQNNFAFETTLSGLAYLTFIKKAKAKGYEIIFFFVYLSGFELAQERVAIRVSKGGHNIPSDVIRRRYFKGMKNFNRYSSEATDLYVYDNSGTEYVLVAKSINKLTEIFNFEVYNKLTSNAG